MPIINCSDGTQLEVGKEEFARFRDWLVVDSNLAQRISELFWLDMFVGYKRSSLDCRTVLDIVKGLERGEPKNGLKSTSKFKRPPLKGLWHKHHYSGQYLPMNVADNILDDRLKEVAEKLKAEDIPPGERSHRYRGAAMKAVKDSLSDRSTNQKLTGEWIIFAKSNDENFYLSLGYHNLGCPSTERDQFLIDRIRQHCVQEFPGALDFLK